MATKRGEKISLLELREVNGESRSSFKRPNFKRENEYIERVILPTDTLQGLALLYNTSIADIKRLNQLLTDQELHARRVIKVPSRGILINLDPLPTTFANPSGPIPSFNPSTTFSIHHDEDDLDDSNSVENDTSTYLNSKDSLLTELRAKSDQNAANSPILNGSGSETDLEIYQKRMHSTLLNKQNESPLKWWHVLFPCLTFVILFPILLFIFQEHLHDLGHRHTDSNPTSDLLHRSTEYIVPD